VAGVEVVALDGRRWTVRRRWLPGYADRAFRRARTRRRRRHDADDLADAAEAASWGFDLDDALWIAGVVLLVLALLFVVPLVLDLVIVAVAVVLGGVARTLLRRPWTVEAIADDGERRTRPVVGWRAAGRAAEDWAEELRMGIERQ
jgi:hypothetical protein